MLIQRMETPSEELKRYVRFTASDAAHLAGARPRVEPHFERIAAEFYERIREHEGAHATLSGEEEQIARLQRSLVAWLERLFGGVYDEQYFAKTEQIGRVHVQVGLAQRYVLAAMALVRSSLNALLDESDDRETTINEEGACNALNRLLDIELAIMLDAYQAHLLARVERAAELHDEAERRRATPFEEHAVMALEIAPLLVVAIDDEGSIVLFNRAAEQATGYAQDEVLGRDFARVVLPNTTQAAQAGQIGRSAPIGSIDEDIQLPLATRAGKVRTIRWRIVRATHAPIAFAFGLDVTDDAAVREKDERQHRLAALGILTTGLAHEIRNPLNGARLHTAYLERALVGSAVEILDAVQVVKNEIQRLARLVDEFLDFAQPRPLILSPVDVRALIKRVVDGNERIGADLPRTDLVFPGDSARLEHALKNLVANALEAGAEEVVVRVRREPRFVRFEVEDNGPGFEIGAPVFNAFYTTKSDGTGLGLAIAHRIVTDHQGTIDADSRPGNTRFRIKLPCTGEGTTR